MTVNDLNKKLLSFAGFTEGKIEDIEVWYRPNHKLGDLPFRDFPPDLVNSLDAQKEWLYPKLFDKNIRFSIHEEDGKFYMTIGGDGMAYEAVSGNNLANVFAKILVEFLKREKIS